MPYKQWAYLEKVSSADFQSYLQNQVVAQFTSTAQRDAQWPTPAVGSQCVTTDTLTKWIYNGTAWVSLTYYNMRASRAATLTMPTTPTLIVMDTEQYDPSNSFNNTTGVYTCKVAGTYLVKFQIGATLGGAYVLNANIYKNATLACVVNAYQANGAIIVGASDLLVCAVGDTIDPRAQANVAGVGIRNNTTDTHLDIAYLGQ